MQRTIARVVLGLVAIGLPVTMVASARPTPAPGTAERPGAQQPPPGGQTKPAEVDPQGPILTTSVDIVPLFVTAFDREQRLVADLIKEDFEVLDNGVVQPLSIFQSEIVPVNVVVMLDTSLSMTLNLDLVKAGAEQFFLRLLPDDRATIGAFNDRIHFPRDPADGLSGDRDELVSLIKELDFGNGTKMYDGIEASLVALKDVKGRRVVLVLTDGDDTTSRMGLGDVMDRARDEDVMVYAIGIESVLTVGGRSQRTRPDRGLKKLAEETGGGYFELKKTDDLGTTFTRVAQHLHTQYVLGFEPAVLDGRIHKLNVRVKRPGMTTRARKSYLASPARNTTSEGSRQGAAGRR